MKRVRGLIAAGIALVSLVAAMPSASAVSTTVTSGKISCYVEAKTPAYVKSSTGVVTVTGAFRLTCKTTSTSTSINVTVAPSVVELDADRFGKFTVIDTRTELAESSSIVTYRVGSESYKDLTTKSFTCVNTDTATTNDPEELSTRVKVSIVGGTWSTYDLSAYLSAPC
ncbi:MAG: hypothetical protein F2934_09845 [Actinobacteria bacterium]|uniref:Unannotated protein n=1 Tax=freshwater metagenome TaxID=449393 RepID=A0A6J6PQW7_9ZZZZ|nr:hypothetical protein [Actinomycetota bacterium]MSZ04227.1 hypothetical protein [Actinomycetota bacterium]MTB07414.1 hypothetical protein [Actinomycetota bacterium]